MTEEQFLRTLVNPYWCQGSPLHWQADGIGIAHFAKEGRVGLFNLSYLMLQHNFPPQRKEVYQQTDLRWVIMMSGGTYLNKVSLEHHAAMKSLRDFSRLILPVAEARINIPGAIPWATISKIVKGVLA